MLNQTNYIQSNPEIMLGKPVIKGTRITVETIIERMSAGESIEQILLAYPQINKESILAALAFAAKALHADVVYPVKEFV